MRASSGKGSGRFRFQVRDVKATTFERDAVRQRLQVEVSIG
jgi:hypothetical protein